MQKQYKNSLLVVTLLFLAISAIGSAAAVDVIDSELWKEDISYYKSALEERHIDLFHSIDEEAFNHDIEELITKLSVLNKHEIMVEMMRITKRIGDGHTQFSAMGGSHHHYPFSLEWLDGKIRVMAASSDYKQLLGHELIAIDGVPLSDVIDRVEPVMQGVENDYSLQAAFRWHLNVSELLYGLHITPVLGHATFTFIDEKNSPINISADAISMGEFASSVVHRLNLDRGVFSQANIKDSDDLWLSSNEALNTAYLYFSRYPSQSHMLSFAEDVERYLNKNNIKNLIIDLRDNGGGDFFVGLLLARYLVLVDGLNWNDGVYVLIGGQTYSAGMSNAAQYRNILNATLVGEPTGANPVGYQDVDGFSLPNSKRTVRYSKRMYRFQDKATDGVIPDYQVKNDWESYSSGKDKQLAYIISIIQKNK